jgi:gliding motility-associated-like protein
LKYTQPITIRPLPNTDFVLPASVCLPIGAANFVDATTIPLNNTITKWKWNFGDGGIDSTQNPLHNYAVLGNDSVKLRVTSNFGCWKDTVKVLSNIYAQPKAKFEVSNFVCLRDTTIYTDSSNGMGSNIVKWNWRFGDGNSDTLKNTKHLYASTAVDTVTLFVVTDKGCVSDTAKKTTIVNALPSAGFYTQALNNYCENKAIKIIDTASDHSISTANLTRWYWNMGNGNTYNLTNGGLNTSFNEYYQSFNSYQIKMMVENSLGCKSDTLTKSITIHSQPHIGFVLPEVCLADAAANFTDTSSIADGSTAAAYLWNYNAGSPAISPGPSIATSTSKNGTTHYNLVGNYKVSFKITSSFGCDSTLSQPFTVNGSIPHPNFIVLKNATLCSNDSIRIADSSYVDFGTVTKNEIYWNYIGPTSTASLDDNPFMLKGYATIYLNFSNPASKTYQIRMTAHSGNSNICANTVTKTVTIHQSPQVQFTTIPGICNDTTSRQMIQATEIGSVPGTFKFSGTGISSTGLFTPNSVTAGTYPIKYVYTTAYTCADSAIKSITIWPSPIAKWGTTAILCEKNIIGFTDSSIANYSNIVHRYWNFGNGTDTIFSNTTTFNKQYNSANNYSVSLRVMTDSGCRSTFNIQNFKVNSLPTVDFNLPIICLPDGKGTFVNLTTIGDGSDALLTYLWNFGDPNDPSASTLKQPTHQYTAVGPVNVQLKVTSKDLCIDSLTKVLSSIYPQPKAAFSNNVDTVCVNNQISFTDKSFALTSTVNAWNWNFGNGLLLNLQNPTMNFVDSGAITVSLFIYSTQGCISDTATKQISIQPYPVLKLGPSKVVLDQGQTAIVPQYVFGRGLQYLWTPSDYLNSDTAAVPISTPKADITYKLTLTGLGNCSVTDSIFIKVLFAPLVPNAFSPNGDGINDTWKILYLESYPGAIIDVFNRYGQKVFSSTGYYTEWDGTYNGTALPIGTYYYIINPKNGRALINGSVTIIK